VAAAQETVEFVHEQIEGLVGVVAADAGEQIRAGDLDVAFGDELRADAVGLVELEIDAQTDEVVVVAQEAGGFFRDGGAQGVGELEVDPADDELGSEVGREVF
jgi:hypothetical protein